MSSQSENSLQGNKVLEKDAYAYKLYKNVVENLKEGIWIGKKNKTLTTLYWNKGAEKISGFKKTELKGKNLLNIVPGLQQIVEDITSKPQNKKKRRINLERALYNYAKGRKAPLYLNIQASFLTAEKMIVVIFEDITEKAAMEQDIIQQNQKLSALNQIGHTVNQTLELNTVLNTSLDKILEVMN